MRESFLQKDSHSFEIIKIHECAIAALMKQIDSVYIGASSITQNGGIINSVFIILLVTFLKLVLYFSCFFEVLF